MATRQLTQERKAAPVKRATLADFVDELGKAFKDAGITMEEALATLEKVRARKRKTRKDRR